MATKVKKISDKQLKTAAKNVFSDTEYFEMWFAAKWKMVACVAVAAAVAIAAAVGVWKSMAAKERAIAQSFAKANTVEELEKVIAANPKHSGAVLAQCRLADLFISTGDVKKALETLQSVINNDAADAYLQGKAMLVSAQLLENQGNNLGAAPLYRQVLNRGTLPASLRAEAGCALATLEAASGDVKQATATIRQVTSLANLNEIWKMQSQELALAIANGEIAKTVAKPAAKPAVKPVTQPAAKPAVKPVKK